MRSLLQPDQIWYGGLVRSEAAMRIMSDIGSKLTHTFQVTNDGPWHVEDFNVLIEWPHSLVKKHNNGLQRLLYLTEMPEVTPPGIGECYVNSKHINALGLRDAVRRPPLYTNRRPPRPYKKSDPVIDRRKKKRRRRRRSLQDYNVNSNVISRDTWTMQEASSTQAYSYSHHKEAISASISAPSADIVLDCADTQQVQCHIFTCRIHGGLRANASTVIRLRSRVWNSTLVEEFGPAAASVAIHAKAHLGT